MKSLRPFFRNFMSCSDFLTNVTILCSGTLIAQTIPIVISPLLTRLYYPEDFGVLAVFVAISSVLSGFSTGKYEVAVMLPKKDTHAILLIVISLSICMVMVLGVTLILFVMGGGWLEFVGSLSLKEWMYLLPFCMLLNGCNSTLGYWANRMRRYSRLAKSNIAKSVAFSLVSLALGFLGVGLFGLLAGLLAGQLVVSVILFAGLVKDLPKNGVIHSKSRFLVLVRKYKDFPMFSAPAAMLNSAASNAPAFFIGGIYSIYQVGLYNLTTRVVQAPSVLVGGAIGQVYHQKISSELHKGANLTPILLDTSKNLFLIALLPSLVLMLWAPDIFEIVFGENWGEAGRYAQILVVAFLVKFSVSPITTIFSVSGHIKRGACWRTLYFLTTYSVLWFASMLTIKSFLIVYVFHEVVLYGFYFFLAVKSSRDQFDRKFEEVEL